MRALLPLLCVLPLCAQDEDRAFTGVWHLQTGESEIRPLPSPPPLVLAIHHEGQSVTCANGHCAFSTDGKPNRIQLKNEVHNTSAKWEGRALLISTLVSGPRNYTIMDRWMLSRDRNVLRIRRQIVNAYGETESNLVYSREGVRDVSGAPSAPHVSEAAPHEYTLEAGTRIPLKLINSISTKASAEGDRIYLETAFPVVSEGRVVIPVGSSVAGTVTSVVRPGKVRGRGEIFLRFDSLSLPNGVTREFRARPGGLDADAAGSLDRSEGKIAGEGNKRGDAQTAGKAAGAGAAIGGMAGSVAGRGAMGAGVGAAGGAAAGLAGILMSRGPDVSMPKGTIVEMVLDRTLRFSDVELAPR